MRHKTVRSSLGKRFLDDFAMLCIEPGWLLLYLELDCARDSDAQSLAAGREGGRS